MGFKIEHGRCLLRAVPEKGETLLVVPEQVRTIGQYAFSQCRGVREIILPDKLVRIERNAFQNCLSLEKLRIPKTVTVIEESALSGCRSLQNLILPEGLTELAPRVFQNCASLQEITVPDGTLSVGRQAFAGCTSLQRFTPGEQTLLYDEKAFQGCNALHEIPLYVDGTVYNAAAAAQSLYLGRVIRIIRGVQEKRQFGRLEVHWLAYHGCGYTPLQGTVKAESARYLETFLSEKRWNDAEALLADSLVSASTFDKTLSEFWHPEKTAPAWNYYILMHRSERALDLLKKHCSYSLPNIIKSGDAKTMSVMIEHGWITRDNINTMIQLAIDHKAVEVQSQLLNYKMKKGMYTDPAEDLLL